MLSIFGARSPANVHPSRKIPDPINPRLRKSPTITPVRLISQLQNFCCPVKLKSKISYRARRRTMRCRAVIRENQVNGSTSKKLNCLGSNKFDSLGYSIPFLPKPVSGVVYTHKLQLKSYPYFFGTLYCTVHVHDMNYKMWLKNSR